MVSLIHYGWVKWAALPMYVVSVGLTILTYTSMGEQHGGAKCWLRIKGIGTFQPSQMAVIAARMSDAEIAALSDYVEGLNAGK